MKRISQLVSIALIATGVVLSSPMVMGPVGIAAEEEVKIRQPWYIVGVWCFDTCSHLLQQCCCEDGVPPTYPDCLEEPE
jgi:hypothetical protein